MVVEEKLQQLLQVLQPLYREIRQQSTRLRDLETVPLARDMYEQALALEDERLSLLHKQRQILEEERSMLMQSRETAHPELPMLSAKRQRTRYSIWNVPQHPTITPVYRKEQERTAGDRTQIQKLINRWKFVWKIDPATIGQFNRIIANIERPIGEALALLDWSLYQERIYTGESLAAHLERLKQWHTELAEYRVWLNAELLTQEIRFQGLLQVWEIWREREQSQGNKRWQTFLERTRQAKQIEIARITQDINEISQEIGRIKEKEGSGYE